MKTKNCCRSYGSPLSMERRRLPLPYFLCVATMSLVVATNSGVFGFTSTTCRHGLSSFSSAVTIRRQNAPQCTLLLSQVHAMTTPTTTIPTMLRMSESASIENDADPIASLEQLNDLVPRSRITPLIKSKSNVQGALQTCWHFACLAAAAWLVPQHWHGQYYYFLSLLALAFPTSFYFCGLHECVHRTAFASTFLNDAMAQVFGFLCLRPAIHYRFYHWQHHKYTGNRELDSELQTDSFLDFPVNSIATYLLYLSGIPFWIDAVGTTLRHARGDCNEMYLNTAKARQEVTREARLYVILYAALTVLGFALPSLGRALVQFWILPSLLGQPFLRFYLAAEHRGRSPTPNNIMENTRTMRTNLLYRKMAWNMPYHTEHHAWPAIPFHRLDEAHDLLEEAAAGVLAQGPAPPSQNLFHQGEHILPTTGGPYGYLRFHWEFVRHLVRRRRSSSVDQDG